MVDDADERAKQAQEKAEDSGLKSESREAATRAEIIESAGIDGWKSCCFPVSEEIRTGDREYEPLVSLETIERLTQSEQIEESG